MKKPFVARMYWVIAVAWLLMVLTKGPTGAALAEFVVKGILVIATVIAAGSLAFLAFARHQIKHDSMRHLADGSTAVGKAVIGFAFMAIGFTAIAWWFIALAVVRAAVSFWAEENMNRVL